MDVSLQVNFFSLQTNLKSAFDIGPKFFDNLLLTLTLSDCKVSSLFYPRGPVTRVCISDKASSFLEDYPPSANVPGIATRFPINVDMACCDSTKVQRCGSKGAQGVNHSTALVLASTQLAESLDFDVIIIAGTVATPFDGHQCLIESSKGLGLRQG